MNRLNYDKIIQDQSTPQVIKALAALILKQSYLTVGQWLKTVSNLDLQHLIQLGEMMEQGNQEATTVYFLATALFTSSEGFDLEEDELVIGNRMKYLVCVIAMEHMHRLGLIELIHDRVSIGSDSEDLTIATVITDEHITKLKDDDETI